MNSERSAWTGVVATVVACALLAACDGLSDVGEQENQTPIAVAHVVGYAVPGSNGPIDVRAQSELVLTGKESEDQDKPIVKFHWEPSNEAAQRATLTVRNSSTVSVTVPDVSGPDPTPMEFTLTVTDSDGDTDSTTVTIRVHPILDSNRFLQDVRNAARLRVVAARAWTAGQRETRGEFDLQIRAHVTYQTRAGSQNTVHYDVGSPVSGEWLASNDDCTLAPPDRPTACTGDGAGDFRNPLFQFDIPAVDLDAIARQFQEDLANSPVGEPDPALADDAANNMPDPAFVDQASLALSIVLTPRTATPVATIYVLDRNDAVVAETTNNGSGAAVDLRLEHYVRDPAFPDRITVNELLIASGGLENVDTAKSYYAAIDPGADGVKDTLEKWLTANCFDSTADDYRADAHAVYVNNFDLGFGRDMYFRTQECTLNPGTVASVVVNYLTLENAVKKIDPIIAVAMENVDLDPTDTVPGVATFYAFAPEQGIEGGTGGFRRVQSVNFDGRGEKFLPGACTVCHGGRPLQPTPGAPATWAQLYDNTGGDVGATFMPFDLESFLYASSTDQTEVDATFPTDPANESFRTQYSRGNQESSFSALNLAAYHTYGSVNGSDFTCYGVDERRPKGFEGPCELVELWYGGAPTPDASFIDGETASGWIAEGHDLYQDVFARHCRACHVQQVASDGDGRLQFRTHADFIANSEAIKRQVFDMGGMPGSRLTMDRLWQPIAGQEQSAGHILAAAGPELDGTPPGDAVACFSPVGDSSSLGEEPATRPRVFRNVPIMMSSDCSHFASSVLWQLEKPGPSLARLTAEHSIRTAFTPDKSNDYDLALTATGPTGEPVQATKYGHVENIEPAAIPRTIQVNLNVLTPIDVRAIPGVVVGDSPFTIAIESFSGAGFTAAPDTTDPIDPSVFEVRATQLSGGTVTYSIIDDDLESRSAILTFEVVAIAANDLSTSVDAITVAEFPASYEIILPISGQGGTVTVTPNPISGPVLIGTLDGTGVVSSIAQCLSDPTKFCAYYSPPPATISHFSTTEIGNTDSFTYEACLTGPLGGCDEGEVTVQIAGRHPFDPVAAVLKSSTCSGSTCHTSTVPQPGASWTLPNGSSTDDKVVWCAVRKTLGIDGDADDLYPGDEGQPLVNPASPFSSLLYLKPTGLVTHSGGTRFDEFDDRARAIRNWIAEGGAFTGSSPTGQTCP